VAGKGYRHGTDRLVTPAETLDRVRPHLAAMGITRLANVTGLDVIGVPVVMAVRTNARGLAVAQGKGLTLDSAKASAVMETIESYHAEHITLPLVLGSHAELRPGRPLIDVAGLRTGPSGPFHTDRPALWMEGWT
jgi:ribosomal protein S12 methylthiotransferase accessory factor